MISKLRDDITAPSYKANPDEKKIYKKVLNTAIKLLRRKFGEIAVKVAKQLADPKTKTSCENEIANATRKSVIQGKWLQVWPGREEECQKYRR